MIIRRAKTEEAQPLTQIALEAKRYWGYPEHWITHWKQDLTISPEFIDQNEVFVAETGGQLLGFYALVVKNDKAELEHMWVAPAQIGHGVGKELFIHAMHQAAGQNVTEVKILADPNAEAFYEKMGASKIGEVRSEMEGQPRVLPHLKLDPRLQNRER